MKTMKRDTSAFKLRFLAYKDGKSVNDIYGIPKYEDGKVKIGHNVSHAKLNSDGTFTDDYTRTFEDMVVTPKRTELKLGSYSANNWNYAKAHRKDWMKTFLPEGVVDDKPLENVYPEFDLLLGGRLIATELFPLKSSIKGTTKEILDFDDIAKKVAKMKADDDAWRAAHPEYEIENILKKPKLLDVYEPIVEQHPELISKTPKTIIREPSVDINTRINDGFIERFAKLHTDYTDDVISAYEKLIIPRRARAYTAEQLTSGVYKINKYLDDVGQSEIDFSTPEGLKIASDHGWSFDEIADYNNYRDYMSRLLKYKTGPWLEYTDDVWSLRYPVNKKTGGLVVGDYSVDKDRIRTLGTQPLLHESRHRMDNFMPLLDREKKALKDAYGHLSNNEIDGFIINNDELVTTNTELRNELLKYNNAENMSLRTQQQLLNNPTYYSDERILNELEFVNNYGRKIANAIRNNLQRYQVALGRTSLPREEVTRRLIEKKRDYADNIRNALMYVGGGALAIKPLSKITE